MDFIRNYLQKNDNFLNIKKFKLKDINSVEYLKWYNQTYKAKLEISTIFQKSQFKDKKELSLNQLEKFFKSMRKFAHNRSLSNLIYRLNGLEHFNKQLWNLYYGERTLPYRFEEFIRLEKVGQQTASQFLVVFDWDQYPISTRKMEQALALDAEIKNKIKHEIFNKYEISKLDNISKRTTNFLIYFEVYKQIKFLLNLDNFYQINIILWRYLQIVKLKSKSKTNFIQTDEDIEDEVEENLLELPFKAYDGNEKYLFVSYAHDDKIIVYKDMNIVHSEGYNIWYDEGIPPASEWPAAIEKAIENCHLFIVYISQNSIERDMVRKEIHYALEKKKPFLAIFMEKTELKHGLALTMTNIQNLLKYKFKEEYYKDKLFKTINEYLELP